MPVKFSSRTPWRAKLEKRKVQPPKIVRVPAKWRKPFGAGTMAIAHPLHVDALIRTVRKGKLVTQTKLRERLAKKYHAAHLPAHHGRFRENHRRGRLGARLLPPGTL